MKNNLFEKLKQGKCIVYDGDLIGWVECTVYEKHDFGNYIRAKVETADGTKLYRFFKEVVLSDEIIEDGCVYGYKKTTI